MATIRPGGPLALSYTDHAILDGIRAGRRDVELAVELGITTADLKARVDRLVRTAGVGGRGDLAGWDPSAVPAPAPPVAQDDVPGVPPAGSRIPALRLAATVGVILAASLAGYLWLARSAGPAAAPATPPTATSVSVTPLAPPVRYEDLEALPPIELPEGLVLFVLRGCEGCSSPLSLDRVFRDRIGVIHADTLLRPEPGDRLLGIWASPDASLLVASVCSEGSCEGPGAGSRVLRSTDAGATWALAGEVPYAAVPVGITASGAPIVGITASTGEFVEYLVVIQATGAGSGLPASGTSLPVAVLRATLDPEISRALVTARASPTGALAYTWYPESPFPDTRGIVTVLGLADQTGQPQRSFAHFGSPLIVGGWLNKHTLVATLRMSPDIDIRFEPSSDTTSFYLPVLIDIEAATVTAITSFGLEHNTVGATNEVVAAMEGDFLHVPGDDGSCIPIQSAPRDDALVRGCIAAGSFVDLLETRLVASLDWLHVRTPGGLTGWIRPGLIEPGPLSG